MDRVEKNYLIDHDMLEQFAHDNGLDLVADNALEQELQYIYEECEQANRSSNKIVSIRNYRKSEKRNH